MFDVSTVPLFSVLMPVRNGERTLALALRSILRQSEPRWEALIVDDGSSDLSSAIARAFADHDPRFRVLTLPACGIVHALNAGLQECRGELVARLDADDFMHRRRLELQHQALARAPELAGVGTHVRSFPRSTLQGGRRAYERWLNSITSAEDVAREAYVECPLAHPTICLRRSVLVELGYRDAGWPEDYDLVLRLLASGRRLAVVPKRLVAWRNEPSRLSRTHPAYAIERFTECKAAYLARGFLAASSRYILWGYGDTGRALCRALAARGKHPAHIVELHPGRIGQQIAGARVIAPESLPHVARAPIVASVAGLEARTLIRAALRDMRFEELRDFVVAA